MPTPDQTTVSLQAAAIKYLGDAQAEESLQALLRMVRQMLQGTDWYGRPAGRRSTYTAAAKAARKLEENLSKLNVCILARAFGGHAPGDGVATLGLEGAGHAASPSPSIPASTPDRIRAAECFRGDLAALAAVLTHLSEGEPPALRGNPEVPDPVNYGIEALAWEWFRHRGADPKRGKAGRFEDFAIDVLSCLAPAVQQAEVRTGLRRFFERGGLDGLRSQPAQTG